MPIPLIILIVVALVAAGGFYLTQSGSVPATKEDADVSDTTVLPLDSATSTDDSNTTPTATSSTSDTSAADSGEMYTDGTYAAVATYVAPSGIEHVIGVELTLAADAVTTATVTYDGGPAETPSHERFETAFQAEVIGVPLNDVALSRTGGASLTSDAFNQAVEIIKQEAAAS